MGIETVEVENESDMSKNSDLLTTMSLPTVLGLPLGTYKPTYVLTVSYSKVFFHVSENKGNK